MKTLKTGIFTILAIGFLTGSSQLKHIKAPVENSNHKVTNSKVKLTTLMDIKKIDIP